MPPIVVIASEGRLTIASRDVEALNQFEELMKTLQRGRRVAISNGNFSMFLLQNAAAKDLATTLTELFRQVHARPNAETTDRFAAAPPT